MFRVEFAPDAVCQLERLMTEQLGTGGKAAAYDFLDRLENCIAELRAKPMSGGLRMDGIPRRYRVREISSGIILIYQVDEEMSCVRVDGTMEKCTDGDRQL